VTLPAFQNPVLAAAAADFLAPGEVSPAASAAIADQLASACSVHLAQVWRQLRAMGVAERHLDDATQEVFLVALRKLGSFDGQAKVSTWLYAIAYRVGCNFRRHAQREPRDPLVETDHRSEDPSPEQSLAQKQAAELVQRFCDGLSEKLRDVFVLCLLEGLSPTEVAVLLGLSENTIYSRIRLAREALRQELDRQEVGAT
jgi:RNA polymerase sigma-70 factor (ECF subfamily)